MSHAARSRAGYSATMPAPPRSQSPAELHDRPVSVPALVFPIPSSNGALSRGGTPPRVTSSTAPTLETGEASGSLILVPGSAPYAQTSAGGTPLVLATDADLVTAEGRISALEAITVAATAGAGAKLVLAEPTGGGASTVTMQAPALAASRTITVPDADVALADIATNSTLRTTIADQLVVAAVAVADVTGGATDGTLTMTLLRADNSTAIASARQVMINAGSEQYNHFAALSATVTFSAATTGSIVASGNGWALVQTSAAGAFACTVANSADETVYFSVDGASAGVSNLATRCAVLGSNSDAATWSA